MAEEAPVTAGVFRALERRVSDAVGCLQEKEEELQRLLREQQEELHRLRAQQESLQEHMAMQGQRSREVGGGQANPEKGSTNVLEHQLRDLVTELRKLQQDQHLHQEAEVTATVSRTVQQLQAETFAGAMSVLKELRDERGIVAEMLDNVKKEKCEVIAMMHTFATSKGEAMEELEGLRQSAFEEISAAAVMMQKVVGCRGHSEVSALCRGGREPYREEVEAPGSSAAVLPASVLHGRQGSRTSLCPASVQGAPLGVLSGPHPGVPLVTMQGTASSVTVLTATNSLVQAGSRQRTPSPA